MSDDGMVPTRELKVERTYERARMHAKIFLSSLGFLVIGICQLKTLVMISTQASAARRLFKRFVDLVVCRVQPTAARSWAGSFKIDGRFVGATLVLCLSVGAHQREQVRLAAAHGVHPS